MKLIWKFNLVLLGIFVLGFLIAGFISYRALQANAREEILQNARLMMESALVGAQLHDHAGEAPARYADEVPVPAADGARLRGNRAVQRAAQEASGLRVQGGDAQSDQPAQPCVRLGSGRRQRISQHVDDQRDHRRARHADRPLALSVAADPDQERGMPDLPQHRRCRAQDDARPLRQRERLRLEDGGSDRRPDRLGADDRADRARQQDVQRRSWARSRSSSSRFSCCST